MALMNCPECGKEISDKARNCPSCGFPIEDSREFGDEIEGYENGWNTTSKIQLEYAENDNLQKRSIIDILLNGLRWVSAIFILILSINVLTRGISEFKFLQFLLLLSTSYLISPLSNKLNIYHKQNTLIKVIVCIVLFSSASFMTDIDTKNTETVSTNQQEEIEMPSVVGQQIKEVTEELSNLGLMYGIIREKNEKYDEGIVLACDIPIGQLIDSSTKIMLTVNSFDIDTGEDNIVDTGMINTPVLTAGTYIVGEDIDTGKYNFYAQNGNGSLKIYNSYESYKNDKYGYDAFQDFDVLAEGASRGLLNEDVCTDKIMNIKLIDGQCLTIDKGLKLQYELSEKITDSILPVGVYIINEDLDAGKFNFTAIKGTGSVKIYNSYEEYKQDEYGYDSFVDYDMIEQNASTGLLNEDVYSHSISNIRLEKGQCFVIDGGLALEYTLP